MRTLNAKLWPTVLAVRFVGESSADLLARVHCNQHGTPELDADAELNKVELEFGCFAWQ